MRACRIVILSCSAALFCAFAAAPAGATALGDFTITLDRPPVVAANTNRAEYEYLDTSTSTTMRLMSGATELARSTSAAGNTRVSAVNAALQPGDRIEIYKPELPAGPPAVAPIDQYTIPAVSLTGAAGATSVSGTAPDGALARVKVGSACQSTTEQSLPVSASGGAFTSPSSPLEAGVDLTLNVYSGTGDYTQFHTAVPGESPCFSAEATPYPEPPTLDPDAATPYSVRVRGLKPSVAANSRFVWRRGAAVIADVADTGNTNIVARSGTQPLPGDVLEIYRPQTALQPSRTVTIPAASAIVDPAASLVAVNSPSVSGFVDIFAADLPPTERSSRRAFLSLPAGRTLVDFNAPQADNRAFQMRADGRVFVNWSSPDSRIEYYFYAAPGDLVAPTVSPRLSSRLKLSKIKKSVSLRLRSSELAAGSASLTIAKKLPGKGHPKTKPGKRSTTFAKAKISLSAGTNLVKLKLTKAGKRALKQLRGAGRSMRPVKVTLKLRFTDPSGNAGAVTRSFKLVSR